MIFTPQKYAIEDLPGKPFLSPEEIEGFLRDTADPSEAQIHEVLQVAANKQRLTLRQTALLLNAPAEIRKTVLEAAHRLKEEVYGERIVLFAPLYIGNHCTNRCAYCSFRVDNPAAQRRTLIRSEIIEETKALEAQGHKRLILVYGEHRLYDACYIADTVGTVYATHNGPGGAIRRVNINAAPFDVEGFRVIKQAGIGTYQIFQETYHPEAYARYHLGGPKRDFDWRLTAFDRAMEAGIDDVGLGALLGLYDWRFEIMALVRHTNHLEACFGVGPHTISFPRIKESSQSLPVDHPVSDYDFIYAIAVLRLAVPYTGLILTAREPASVRDAAIRYGVSQIDGGTRLEIGSYASAPDPGTGQFAINDNRPLDDIIAGLIMDGHIPSFCTACYRQGRTGEHFMEFSVPGFIKRFCTPNALLTLAEYLEDYASPATAQAGWALIGQDLASLEGEPLLPELRQRLDRIRDGERDLYF